MSVFTTRQRNQLKHRLSRAICWTEVPGLYRTRAESLAETVIREMETTYLGAAAGRRAVQSLITKIEERQERSA